MKLQIFTLLLLISINSEAQTANRTEYSIWHIYKDATAMVYANKVNIRSGANISATIIDSLQVGDTVYVAYITNNFYRQNGVHAAWALVKYSKDSKVREGHLWLGSLALGYQIKNQEAFVLGIDEAKSVVSKDDATTKENIYTVRLKLINNKKQKTSSTLFIKDDESFSYIEVKLLGNPMLKNIKEVVRIMFSGQACGVPAYYYYFGLSTNEFLNLPSKYSVGDADIYYHAESLIFPNEVGGKPNKIIKYIEEEELVEEATATKKEKRKKTNQTQTYTWDGEKAILIKR